MALLIYFIAGMFVNRKRVAKYNKRAKVMYDFIAIEFEKLELTTKEIKRNSLLKDIKLFEDQYIKLNQAISITKIQNKVIELFRKKKQFDFHIKKLSKGKEHERIHSANVLGRLPCDESVEALQNAILIEKSLLVKLYLSNSLANLNYESSIPFIVNTIHEAPSWYCEKVYGLISEFKQKFYDFIPEVINSEVPEIQKLIIHFSKEYIADDLRNYLDELARTDDYSIARLATEALSKNYYYMLDSKFFLEHSDNTIRNIAIKSLETLHTKKNLVKLINLLKIPHSEEYAVYSISTILRKAPHFVDFIADKFHDETNLTVKRSLTEILSNRIEYFLMQIKSREKKYIKLLVQEIILIGKTSQIIGFLNKNKDIEIEKETLSVISKIIFGKKGIDFKYKKELTNFLTKLKGGEIEREVLDRINDSKLVETDIKFENTAEIVEYLNTIENKNIEKKLYSLIAKIYIKTDFRTYLNDTLLDKINLTPYSPPKKRRDEKLERDKIKFLQIILAFVLLFFPIVFCLRHFNLFAAKSWWTLTKLYVIDFNYYLIFYSTSINFIYLILLGISLVGVKKQIKYWQLKERSFMFKSKILPSISIIAPAYGEQETIIESVNSLLNLQYPDYELVVVNDGSPDNTLNVLIDYFNLEKVDRVIIEKLKTQPIRGIYINKNIPNLIIVDKANGGKADALNVGINIAQKEFYCGIDSDSLLEADALIKLASTTLDTEKETVAMGGNIFPINGCTVHKGVVEKKRIPNNSLARFQTIEYMRAFMAGRVGWAHINCLLIISGAFGLFRKERVIEMGGYLTSSERYKKDTVGEDMELVVRISRFMRENKTDYAIHYAYNANCWTEVPESWKILRNQRDRWHRGLIDIINFHKKILFSRKYGSMGLVSMPYFFIFEMVGPMFEIQGYIMVLLAAIFGILNKPVAFMLFVSSIVMGVLISVVSLFIAEKETKYFDRSNLIVLIFYAFIENFGLRQYISYWRVKGYFSAMKKPKGWGKMERKVKTTLVLVTENKDDEENLRILFEKQEYKVVTCSDGKQAIEAISKENPHFVISQFDIPKFNGLKIRERMMFSPVQKYIPFLLISDNTSPDMLNQIEELEIIQYSKNPLDYNDIVEQVKGKLQSSTEKQTPGLLSRFVKRKN